MPGSCRRLDSLRPYRALPAWISSVPSTKPDPGMLHSDDDWRIFSITVVSGDTLADHASGPRAILTLTDLEIRRCGLPNRCVMPRYG